MIDLENDLVNKSNLPSIWFANAIVNNRQKIPSFILNDE